MYIDDVNAKNTSQTLNHSVRMPGITSVHLCNSTLKTFFLPCLFTPPHPQIRNLNSEVLKIIWELSPLHHYKRNRSRRHAFCGVLMCKAVPVVSQSTGTVYRNSYLEEAKNCS